MNGSVKSARAKVCVASKNAKSRTTVFKFVIPSFFVTYQHHLAVHIYMKVMHGSNVGGSNQEPIKIAFRKTKQLLAMRVF